jgi:hypothetical protein
VGVPIYSDGSFVYHRSDNRAVKLQPQQDVRFCAVSPDGRWVATGSHSLQEGPGVKVWDAQTGRLVKELPVGAFCRVAFSPDGRWLVTPSGGVRLWAVESWQEGPRLSDAPGYFAFTHDGRLAALEDVPGVVRLVLTESGRELARLTAPERTRLLPRSFTPDGGQLVTFGGETGMVYVFDLRAIRRQLAELGLDWDQPPLPPQDSGETPRQPLTIEVDHGGAAPSLSPQVKSRQRIEQARVLFQERPEDTLVCNELAWAYLTAPEPLRNVKEALALAEKAVKLRPENVIYQDTLALAFYRDGQYRRAVEILEPLLKSQEDRFLATDLYVLAMSHHKLGHAGPARDFFVLAGRWSVKLNDLSPDMREELAAFRAEAVVVLGLEPPPAPKPDHP